MNLKEIVECQKKLSENGVHIVGATYLTTEKFLENFPTHDTWSKVDKHGQHDVMLHAEAYDTVFFSTVSLEKYNDIVDANPDVTKLSFETKPQQYILLNLNKNVCISVKTEDEGYVVDVVKRNGDVVSSDYVFYNELEDEK